MSHNNEERMRFVRWSRRGHAEMKFKEKTPRKPPGPDPFQYLTNQSAWTGETQGEHRDPYTMSAAAVPATAKSPIIINASPGQPHYVEANVPAPTPIIHNAQPRDIDARSVYGFPPDNSGGHKNEYDYAYTDNNTSTAPSVKTSGGVGPKIPYFGPSDERGERTFHYDNEGKTRKHHQDNYGHGHNGGHSRSTDHKNTTGHKSAKSSVTGHKSAKSSVAGHKSAEGSATGHSRARSNATGHSSTGHSSTGHKNTTRHSTANSDATGHKNTTRHSRATGHSQGTGRSHRSV